MQVYTDGSCYPNDGTGDGGWAYSVMNKGFYYVICAYIPKPATNNIAELLAMIAALNDNDYGEIYSDSEYVVKGFNIWMHGWVKKGWKKKKGELKNATLWKKLHELRSKFHGKVFWVRGHNGDFMNELADAGANYARITKPKDVVDFEMSMEEAKAFIEKWAGKDRYRG